MHLSIAIVLYLSTTMIAIVEIGSMLHYKVLKWLSSYPTASKCIVALPLCIICLLTR